MPFGCQLLGAANIIDVIGIAAVDEDVAALEMRQQIGDDIIDHAGRHHQPDGARLRELLDEVGSDVVPTAFSFTSSATALADLSYTTH